MPTGGPGQGNPKAPKTRATQSWSFFWQVYRNNMPRKLDKANALLFAAHTKLVKR